jgi:SAM-dependent methyltransferase
MNLRRALLARITPYGLYDFLRRALKECRSVLDLGCGTDSMVQQFTAGRFVVGVDRYLPSLERNREVSSYAALVNGDIMDLPFAPKSVDAVVALDVIEHFGKADGLRLLRAMERTARRRVIVYTPNGFVPQAASDNPWQQHLSGWTVEEFRVRGYAVYGIYGRKDLRGEYARLIRRPRLWWELVSAASQFRVGRRPEEAFALLAVRGADDVEGPPGDGSRSEARS